MVCAAPHHVSWRTRNRLYVTLGWSWSGYQLHQFLIQPEEFIPHDPFWLMPELALLRNTSSWNSRNTFRRQNLLAQQAACCSGSNTLYATAVRGAAQVQWESQHPTGQKGSLGSSCCPRKQRFGRLIDFPLRINWAVCAEMVSAPCYTHKQLWVHSFRLTAAKSYGNGSTGGNPHACSWSRCGRKGTEGWGGKTWKKSKKLLNWSLPASLEAYAHLMQS